MIFPARRSLPLGAQASTYSPSCDSRQSFVEHANFSCVALRPLCARIPRAAQTHLPPDGRYVRPKRALFLSAHEAGQSDPLLQLCLAPSFDVQPPLRAQDLRTPEGSRLRDSRHRFVDDTISSPRAPILDVRWPTLTRTSIMLPLPRAEDGALLLCSPAFIVEGEGGVDAERREEVHIDGGGDVIPRRGRFARTLLSSVSAACTFPLPYPHISYCILPYLTRLT
ncbi:hypothetical protein DFH06DRAFT_1175225 [Mycena polygramma]|nr:hypothetical protein DFH06DRAFT_1175225 [Mycena polygramma]